MARPLPHVVDLHRDGQGCRPRFNALGPLTGSVRGRRDACSQFCTSTSFDYQRQLLATSCAISWLLAKFEEVTVVITMLELCRT